MIPNAAHIHLLINHFPVVGLVFSLVFLGFGIIRDKKALMEAGLWLVILSGVAGLVTFWTGEPAEHFLEDVVKISEDLVDAHEEAGELALWFIIASMVFSIVGLWSLIKERRLPKVIWVAIFIFNIVTLAMVGRTNNLGGKISHPELRQESPAK